MWKSAATSLLQLLDVFLCVASIAADADF